MTFIKFNKYIEFNYILHINKKDVHNKYIFIKILH